MNQELKLKWHSIYGQILFERKLKEAWRKVEENDGAGGIDGETVASFKKNEDAKLEDLLQRLRNKITSPRRLGGSISPRRTAN